jgi:hypothetical protein
MKKVNLFVVKSKITKGTNTMLFNSGTTLEQVFEKYPSLKEREILSAQNEECEVLPADKGRMQVAYTDLLVDGSGKIIGEKVESNPNDDEMMEIKNSDIAEMEGREDDAEFWKSIGE